MSLFVMGSASHVGKSVTVAAICRCLVNRGISTVLMPRRADQMESLRRHRRNPDYLDFLDLPPALDSWFEHAVDCSAFLAWRLSNQGASIHFRAQGFDFAEG